MYCEFMQNTTEKSTKLKIAFGDLFKAFDSVYHDLLPLVNLLVHKSS